MGRWVLDVLGDRVLLCLRLDRLGLERLGCPSGLVRLCLQRWRVFLLRLLVLACLGHHRRLFGLVVLQVLGCHPFRDFRACQVDPWVQPGQVVLVGRAGLGVRMGTNDTCHRLSTAQEGRFQADQAVLAHRVLQEHLGLHPLL